jgi:uncharacterized membrane protein
LVDVIFDTARNTGSITLRPNRSWTWRANVHLLLTLIVVSSIVPVLLASRGYWLVLPFSAAELLAVFLALYVCVRRTHRQEVIRFSPSELVVETGHRRIERTHCYERFHTRILVHPPRHRWDRSRVAVCCRGRELEVGSFLTHSERRALVRALQDLIDRLNRQSPAAPTDPAGPAPPAARQ